MKRLLIVGDREFVVAAMDSASGFGPGLDVLGLIDSEMDIAEDVRRARPDVIVIDGAARDGRALRRLPELRAKAADALVILAVDDFGQDAVDRARAARTMLCSLPVAARTSSPAPGDRDEVTSSVATPPVSDSKLTGREREILEWVVSGHTNAWIARQLWVTEQTVKFHLTNTYRKLGVANRTEASRAAAERGLVNPLESAPPARSEPGGPVEAIAVPR